MRRLSILVALVGCSDPAQPVPHTQLVGGCDGVLTNEDITSANHVPMGTQIDWPDNPPAGGSHFPYWAAWDREYAMLERGYYVHDEEHGGIILLYHCEAGCPEVVDQLRAVARAMAADATCTSPVTKRVILTEDPLLPAGVQVAAAAWNHAYTASCYDPYVETFARDFYDGGPEHLCADGANLGGTPIEP